MSSVFPLGAKLLYPHMRFLVHQDDDITQEITDQCKESIKRENKKSLSPKRKQRFYMINITVLDVAQRFS